MNNYKVLIFFILSFLSNEVISQANDSLTRFVSLGIIRDYEDESNWIREDLWVETDFDTDGDGLNDRIHVGVTRPVQTETERIKLPVIFSSSPYYGGVSGPTEGLFWDVNHELGEKSGPRIHPEVKTVSNRPILSNRHINNWVPRGYVVVHSSALGTGLSDGALNPGGATEALAPKAVIDWLCGRVKGFSERMGGEEVSAYWSSCSIGMIGTSYNGTIALAAATTGVKGLKAIIPVAPNTSYYHYYRENGLVRSPGGYLGEDIDVLYDYVNSGDTNKRVYVNRVVRDSILLGGMDRETGDYNDFWHERNYLEKLDSVKAAVLVSHGFNDWNVMPYHSYTLYKRLKDKGLPTQIYYHQFGHGGEPPIALMDKWFSRYLKGVGNGVEKDPKAWIVRENDDPGKPTPYDDFPNPKAVEEIFYFSKLNNTNGSLAKTRSFPNDTMSWIDNYKLSGADLIKDLNSPHRLLFITSPLKRDIHISGVPKINLRIASSKSHANLSVWLVALPWNSKENAKIIDNIITRGWADPQNHTSILKGEPLKKGEFYNLSFDLHPDDQIIPAGKQIGLLIFSSDKEFTIHPSPGTELELDLNQSSLILPLVSSD